MKTMIFAAIAAFSAGSPQLLSGPPTGEQFRWAREALEEQMLDYPSARFRDVHADRRRICGFVNGKNRMGAYTGWVQFVVMGVERPTVHLATDDAIGVIPTMCGAPDAPPSEPDYSDRLTHR